MIIGGARNGEQLPRLVYFPCCDHCTHPGDTFPHTFPCLDPRCP